MRNRPMTWAERQVLIRFAIFSLIFALVLPLFHIAPVKAASQKTFEAATSQNLDTLDPAAYTGTTSSETIQQINEGLYRYNAKNKIVPGMVTGTPKVNKAKTVYTFTLRKAKWQNGQAVTAQDFVYGIRRKVSPKYASSMSDILKNGKAVRLNQKPATALGVKAINAHTLQITLEHPVPYIKQFFTNSHFMPVNEKFAKKVGKKFGTAAKYTLSNGPFILKGWNGTNDSWVLQKSPTYYDKQAIKINKVNVQVVKETSTAMNLFDDGELDYTTIPDNNVQKYQHSKYLHQTTTPTIGYLSMNIQRTKTANSHLRRALALAVDKKKLTHNLLQDGSQPLNGLIPTGLATDPSNGKDYRQETGQLLTYDPKQAKSEWRKAQSELKTKHIALELLSADTSQAKSIAEFLQSQLQNHLQGLTINVKAIPVAQRIQFEQDGNYDLAFGTYVPDYADPMALLFMYGSDQKLNFSHYKNQSYDTYLDNINGKYAADSAQRFKTMQSAEKQLLDDAATAPIYQAGFSYLLSNRFNGFGVTPFGQWAQFRYLTPKK
ncbi:peptide ABC transporter substrate-binding protein [Agrilactobacillus fermenti]|uniref:peptide ABC transporter substrate-binding protein n=1 Tax=Agrilactobacillus fermenti TaxID=2586909 RepID=UPI003A5BDDDA